MTPPTPTVTLRSPPAHLPVVLERLTAFLLQANYAFLQTWHSAEHTDVEVFDQHQQLLVRCTLRVAEAPAPVSVLPEAAAPGMPLLSPPLRSLFQELARLCPASTSSP